MSIWGSLIGGFVGFSLAGPIVDTIVNGRTLIIDEFDARLHPILAKAIIQLFNSVDNTSAQILFASPRGATCCLCKGR